MKHTPDGTIVWLSFTVEGETFEVQFPTQFTDDAMAAMSARDDLRMMLGRIADQAKATHFDRLET